jgi:4a-hydroxytetrahydrobiopterin dehydratase
MNLSGADTMTRIAAEDAERRLTGLLGWKIDAGELVKTFNFKDFREALAFVNRVGEAAESAGHHPDIDIRYNRVRLSLVTHDAGGLTEKDFDLASAANEIV